MVSRSRGSRRWWYVLILVACLVAGMQSPPAARGPRGWPVEMVSTASQPAQSALSRVGRGVAGGWSLVAGLGDLHRQNQRLQQQLRQTQAQSEQLAEWKLEVERLRGLLAIREQVTRRAVTARVVGRGPSPWFRTLTVNAGRRDSVQVGAAVMAPEGLLGQVFEVSYASCRVICVSDRLGSVGARLQPERARQVVGVAKGDGSGRCLLTYSNAGAEVRAGDAVVTAGEEHGSLFPAGLLLGHVVLVERRPDQSSLLVRLQPAADPDAAEEVLVLLPTAVELAPPAEPGR
ncbi:MAG: rod shape-determining protein MreC [Fimbriimonadaceae bacterium]|nr:rod shape-determining protein MreC [Fimbriimonadaceae bacterium]